MTKPPPNRKPLITRRRLLITAGLLAGSALATGLYTWRVEPHWVQTVHVDMPIANLPASLVGKTLVQISDLHIGPGVDDDYLISALQSIASLNPDIIVITGDFMTCHFTERISQAVRVLKHLPTPALGTFAIPGNHDYGSSWSDTYIADSLQAHLSDLNIPLLRNQTQTISGLQIVGLDDYWSPNFDPTPVLARVDWSQPALTLCHNPDVVDLPGLHQVKGWILSGHTHGGQCKPPFLPPPLLPVKNKRYTSGTFDIGHDRTLYINRGLGHLLKVRFNCRPEITAFKLSRA
jgi:uncharacterized protein